MRQKAALTISRPSYGNDIEKISITVRDVDAKIAFLEIEIDLDEFTRCITGLSMAECEMEVYGLQNVGKKREYMDIVFEMPDVDYNKKLETAIRLAREAAPEGWESSVYFGSQDSFFTKDGKQYARTRASSCVEKGDTNA